MSTVAQSMKNLLFEQGGIISEIIHLKDFYVPIRGNLRRKRSRAGSLMPDEVNEESANLIYKEIQIIDIETDFDDPRQLDWDLLIKGITLLKEEMTPFNKPVYDKFLKIRTEKTVTVLPHPVIIVVGDLLLWREELRKLFNLSVWIDTDDDVRLSRRVLKNEQMEGLARMTLSDLLKIYEEKTKPAFERFIEPTKKFADTIIPNYGFSTT